MKKTLIVLTISIAVSTWLVADMLNANAPIAAQSTMRQKGMSIEEFQRLSRTDPLAYEKFVNSYQIQERGMTDKLLNAIAYGRYE